MFVRAITASVLPSTRHKGLAYYGSGAVISLEGSAWEAHATVRGTEDYRVEVTRHDDRFTASCTCPFFVGRAEICKHIWAVMLAAERRDLLGGDGSPLPDGSRLNPDAESIDVTPQPSSDRQAAGRPPSRPPSTPWGRLLTTVQQSLSAAEWATPQPRFANGEILYALSSASGSAPDTIGFNVQF